MVTARFDIVAIFIEDEGPIIIGMVGWPQARLAVIAPARCKGGAIKGVHPCPVARGEGCVLGF